MSSKATEPASKMKKTSEGGEAAALTKKPDPAASQGNLKRAGSSSSSLPDPKKSQGEDSVEDEYTYTSSEASDEPGCYKRVRKTNRVQ